MINFAAIVCDRCFDDGLVTLATFFYNENGQRRHCCEDHAIDIADEALRPGGNISPPTLDRSINHIKPRPAVKRP